MSVSTLCQVCESREAEHTCERCGRNVCARHYDDAFGLCVNCAEAADGDGQANGPGRDDAGENIRF